MSKGRVVKGAGDTPFVSGTKGCAPLLVFSEGQQALGGALLPLLLVLPVVPGGGLKEAAGAALVMAGWEICMCSRRW